MKDMKCLNLIALTLAAGLLPRLSAADTYKVESEFYLFLDAKFASITFDNGVAVAAGRGEVFSTPTSLRFDDHVLRFAHGVRTWNEAGTPAPQLFRPVAMPAMVLAERQRGSVLCAMPVEYMEKMPDGSLQPRRIERDSPEAPRYRLTFQAASPDDTDEGLVSCQVEVVTLAGREKIPGVELDVGKPILARFEENFQLPARAGDWSGYLLRRLPGGDYGLLLLIKVTPQLGAGAISAAPMTEDELNRFVSRYSSHPQPGLVERAIKGVGVAGTGYLKARDYEFVGFFAEIFAANPERVDAWRKVIWRQDRTVRNLLRVALRLGKPGAVLSTREHSMQNNSMYWGAFYATGNPAFLRKLVDELVLLDENRRELFNTGSMAMELLSLQADNNPLVRRILEESRPGATPLLQKLITDLLQKPAAVIREDLTQLRLSRDFYRGGYPTGMRDQNGETGNHRSAYPDGEITSSIR